ncbi:hypothetical protein ElyMa_001582700 [Elysia marginata]|uniref:Uncharacterized protein n=1 Tax=Elysia marginata TaxID=1093978 RepID=A0AAV4JHK2_9GAST|nr:hypothetical protein ElyMa_001582700 [Elysia marginata]
MIGLHNVRLALISSFNFINNLKFGLKRKYNPGSSPSPLQLFASLCLAQPPLPLSSFPPARASPSLPFPSPACLRLGACPAFSSLCYICGPALLSPPPPPPTHTHIMSCAASITGPTFVQPQSSSARHWPYPAPTYC